MFLILCNFFSLLLLKSAVQIKLRFFRSPNVIYTFSASLSGSDFQPCGLLTIFTAIQSFSYGSRLAAFGMEINPFNPNALDVSTCGHDYWQKWGEAERSETYVVDVRTGAVQVRRTSATVGSVAETRTPERHGKSSINGLFP